MSYYMVEIGLMTVKINKYFFIQSVIFKLPNVLKDLLLTCAHFRSITTVVFFLLYVCLIFISNATFYPIILISSQILALSKGCIADISYYVQHFTISVFV